MDENENLEIEETEDTGEEIQKAPVKVKKKREVSETIPAGVAYAIFGVIGICIIAAFVFAGWSLLKFRNEVMRTVPVTGDNIVGSAKPEEFNKVLPEPSFEPEQGIDRNKFMSFFTGAEEEIEIEIEPEIDIEIETTEQPEQPVQPVQPSVSTPRPAATAATPRPTPAPEPEPPVSVACWDCSVDGTASCTNCNGLSSGRGNPPDFAHTISPSSDVWWCTPCEGSGTVMCGTCKGTGWVWN